MEGGHFVSVTEESGIDRQDDSSCKISSGGKCSAVFNRLSRLFTCSGDRTLGRRIGLRAALPNFSMTVLAHSLLKRGPIGKSTLALKKCGVLFTDCEAQHRALSIERRTASIGSSNGFFPKHLAASYLPSNQMREVVSGGTKLVRRAAESEKPKIKTQNEGRFQSRTALQH